MKVFLSHVPEDNEAARLLAAELSRAGHEVWDAEQELMPGDNYPLETGKALRDATAFVVLLSPEAVRSQQVRREIDFALTSVQYEGRLISVVVRPTERFPWILRKLGLLPMVAPTETAHRVAERLRACPV